MKKPMVKGLRKGQFNLKRFWHPIIIYHNLKSLYFVVFPKDSRGYKLTYGLLRTFFNQFNLVNIYYQEWIKIFDTIKDNEIKQFKKKIDVMDVKPQFSVIMPVYNPDLEFFEKAMQSVIRQVYPYWELCIADDASTDPRVKEIITNYAAKDSRIKFTFRKKNGHISAASNSALELASNEFVVLLDHDDLLHPFALYYVAEVINDHPDCVIIYSDEDKITKRGKRQDPYFKPNFDYELLLSQNMVSHLGVYRRSAVTEVGGFRIGLEGSQDYDLLLRIVEKNSFTTIHHIPRPLYHWRISKTSVARDVNIKPYAFDAGKRALQEHLDRKSINATVEYLRDLAGYSVNYKLPSPQPTVTLIILEQINTNTISSCINAILSNTNYLNFDVKVVFQEGQASYSNNMLSNWKEKVTFQHQELESNGSYGEVINNSIIKTTSEYICLINDSLYKFPPNWLAELVSQASQTGIGAVAPKLIDSNERVYSNGIILLPDRMPAHLSLGEERDVNGYFGWAKLCRGYSALSEKCLLFRRDHWHAVGGMNEKIHTPLFCGIDFCLKLKAHGLRNVLRPSIELFLQDHDQSEEVGSLKQHLEEDMAYLRDQWDTIITNDPAFNPNLKIIDDGKILVNLSPYLNFNEVN